MFKEIEEIERLQRLLPALGDPEQTAGLAQELQTYLETSMAAKYPELSLSEIRRIKPGQFTPFLQGNGGDMADLAQEIKNPTRLSLIKEDGPENVGEVFKQVQANIDSLGIDEKVAGIDADLGASELSQLSDTLKLNDFKRGINRASLVDGVSTPGVSAELQGLGQSVGQLTSDPQVEIGRAPRQAVENNFKERSTNLRIKQQEENRNNAILETNQRDLLALQKNLNKTTRSLAKFFEEGLLETRDSEKENG